MYHLKFTLLYGYTNIHTRKLIEDNKTYVLFQKKKIKSAWDHSNNQQPITLKDRHQVGTIHS